MPTKVAEYRGTHRGIETGPRYSTTILECRREQRFWVEKFLERAVIMELEKKNGMTYLVGRKSVPRLLK